MAELTNLHASSQPSISDKQQEDQLHSLVQIRHSVSDCSDVDNDVNNNIDGQDSDLYGFRFDSFSPPSPCNFSLSLPPLSNSRFHGFCSTPDSESEESDSDASGYVRDPNYGFGYEEEEDQMNFVTNLFESREARLWDDSNPIYDVLDSMNDNINVRGFEDRYDNEFDADQINELGLGFGHQFNAPEFTEFLSSRDVEIESSSAFSGLRVVGINSDSDSEVVDINSEIDDDVHFGENGVLGSDDLNLPIFWDCLGFNEQRTEHEDFEWEEVGQRANEGSVIDRVDEISVSSDTSFSHENSGDVEEEAVRNLEWEVLLAVNNLERALEIENDEDGDAVSYLAVQDDYVYGAEYDTLFGQFVDSESALKGSPPAAKYVVENLPSVVLKKEDLKDNSVVCAVCKDEIILEEKVTRLPCQHHYHGDCIVPWLTIRNTCPVCRYEFPTDDADYERWKSGRNGHGFSDGLQVRYNFELLP